MKVSFRENYFIAKPPIEHQKRLDNFIKNSQEDSNYRNIAAGVGVVSAGASLLLGAHKNLKGWKKALSVSEVGAATFFASYFIIAGASAIKKMFNNN